MTTHYKILINALLTATTVVLCSASVAKQHSTASQLQAADVKPAAIRQIQSLQSNKSNGGQRIDYHQAVRQKAATGAQPAGPNNQYLVQFHGGSVASQISAETRMLAKGQKSVKQSPQPLNSKQAGVIAQHIVGAQNATLANLKADIPEMTVLGQYQTLFNGAHVRLTNSDVQKLRARADVKAVYPVKMRYPNLDASHQVTNVVQAWEAVGGQAEAGKDVKIAIIDTGIRNENPMFNDTGFAPVDLSDNSHLNTNPDYCRSATGDASFCNNKLIVARHIDPASHGFEVYPQEYLNPKGFDGHGTHVAGIAAGNPVNIEFNHTSVDISGVAPGARLMVYKALYMTNFGLSSAPDTMLLEALELAVLDGADVINNSWGAGSGEDPDASIYNEVFNSAEAAGITIVNAAGNTAHPGATINCPACIESGIAVANTTHGRFFGNRLEVNGKSFLAYQGQNQQLEATLNLRLMSLNSFTPLDDSGCQAMSGDIFTDAIVLVDYKPFCTLEVVANNIRDAGGAAVLIYQAGAFGMGTYEPFLPYQGDFSIPVLGVSRENGLQLVDEAYENAHNLSISHEVEQGVEAQYVDIINPFSSTGPNNNPAVLKPDITAPGTNVLSAWSPDEFSFGPLPGGPGDGPGLPPGGDTPGNPDAPVFSMLTGTSMAAPTVAGAAAMLKQQFPDWSPLEIKSALMSTSNWQTMLGVDPANAFHQGAGRLDAAAALNSRLGFAQPSWSVPSCIGRCVFENTLNNLTDEEQSWQLDIEFFDGESIAQVEPSNITLAPSGSASDSADISFTVDVSRADPDSILFDKWVFGRLVATSQDGQVQHMPIVAYANDSSDEGSLLVSYDGNDLTTQNPVSFVTRLRNKGAAGSATAVLLAPENGVFVAGTENAELRNAQTQSMAMSADNKRLDWQGQLESGSMSLSSSDVWDNFTLANADVAPLPCTDGCNGFNILVDFDFAFNGDNYQSLTISDNGFVVPGNASFGFFSALFNQAFPQADQLNNIIAPFWTEFDLLDESLPGDTGGGYLRAAVRVLEDANYLVVEWDNVQPFVTDDGPGDEGPGDEDPGEGGPAPEGLNDDLPGGDDFPVDDNDNPGVANGFSFQLIIQEGTDNIWFNYINIPFQPDFLSIGAENSDGSIGLNYYFDGNGEFPSVLSDEPSLSLQLATQPEGIASLWVDVMPDDGQDYGVSDVLRLDEDSTGTINVIENDIAQTALTLSSELQLEQEHKAIATANLTTAALDPQSLEILEQPSHGALTVENAQVLLTPDPDFFGSDSFSYRIADVNGHFSRATQVDIVVNPINDAPVLASFTDVTATEGQVVTITPMATDVEGDNLTYTITQLTGVIVEMTANGDSFSFTAPSVDSELAMTFTLVASDGQADSAPQSLNVTITEASSPDDSGGALSSLLWLLTPVLIWRRRKNLS